MVEARSAIRRRHNCLAAGHFAAMADPLARPGSVSALFRQFGLPEVHRRVTQIGTRLPGPFEADCLGIPTRPPIIVATGINVRAQDEVVEVSVSLSRGYRVQLRA